MRFLPILLLSALLTPFLLRANAVFPYKYQESTLENGLRVLLVPMKNSGLVSYFTIVHVGSRDEIEPGKSGFAHFFEHMMFRGTKKYPAERYTEIATEIGADLNAFTGDDFTGYYLHFPGRFLEKVIDIESDRFMNLDYSLPVFQTEAKAVLGEYNKNFANPFFQLEEKLAQTAFGKHTYGHTTMGYLKDIQDMPNQFEYSKMFFDRFYRPNNSMIVVSGSFNPDEALTLIKKYYSPWKRGTYKTVTPEEPAQTEQRSAKVEYQGDTLPIVAIAYKAPAFSPGDKDFAALNLLAELAFGETSAIYQKLVLQEQKVDFVAADYTPHKDPYLFTVYARLKNPADFKYIQDAITATVEDARSKPTDMKKLADLKSNRKYSFLMSFDTSKSVVSGLYASMPPYIALTTGVSSVDALFASYENVAPADLQQAAQKYLQSQKRTIVTLTGAK